MTLSKELFLSILAMVSYSETLEKMGLRRPNRTPNLVLQTSTSTGCHKMLTSCLDWMQVLLRFLARIRRFHGPSFVQIALALAMSESGVLAASDRVEEYGMKIRVVFVTPEEAQIEEFVIRLEAAYVQRGDSEAGIYSDVTEGQAKVVVFPNGSKAAILVHAMTGAMPRSLKKHTGLKRIKTTERLQIFRDLQMPIVLEEQVWPWIVTFPDPAQPLSVKRITNQTIRHTIGRGYQIERIEIEYSEAEPTRSGEIFKWLPWLRNWPSGTLDGKKVHSINTDYPLANSLTDWSFQGVRDLGLER